MALITGASRGIGAATAKELARRGYYLVLAARTVDALDDVAKDASQFGSQTLTVPTDMRDHNAVVQLAHQAIDHFGHIDVLINNAGVVKPLRRLDQLSDADVQSIVATNLIGAITLTRAVLPSMLDRHRGTIVFVGSVGGHIGIPSAAMYSTTKFGLRGFAAALHREVARHGVKVILISAGFIKSELTETLKGVPLGSQEFVARSIAHSIAHPRREVVIPRFYRAAIWLDRALPWSVDRILRLYTAGFLGD